MIFILGWVLALAKDVFLRWTTSQLSCISHEVRPSDAEFHASGQEGPIPYEEKDGDDKRVVYYVETLRSKSVEGTLPAILRIIGKIEGKHQV